MIARYSRPEMARIWEDRCRYQLWLKVEMAVCQEMAQLGMIPRKDWRELQSQVQRTAQAQAAWIPRAWIITSR